MSVLDGPGEGSWSVFAEKVVAERDAAREEAALLRREIEIERRRRNMAEAFHRVAVAERNFERQVAANLLDEIREFVRAEQDLAVSLDCREFVTDEEIRRRDVAWSRLVDRAKASTPLPPAGEAGDERT